MSPSDACDLCRASPLTQRYYDDDECWIADCLVCRVPMVVWSEHQREPPSAVRSRLIDRLGVVADTFFSGRSWYYDDRMRRIPEHYHGHARAG
jgi:hypothetical protein